MGDRSMVNARGPGPPSRPRVSAFVIAAVLAGAVLLSSLGVSAAPPAPDMPRGASEARAVAPGMTSLDQARLRLPPSLAGPWIPPGVPDGFGGGVPPQASTAPAADPPLPRVPAPPTMDFVPPINLP